MAMEHQHFELEIFATWNVCFSIVMLGFGAVKEGFAPFFAHLSTGPHDFLEGLQLWSKLFLFDVSRT